MPTNTQENLIPTTIILIKHDLIHGQICRSHECPLALAINRYLKPEYYAVVYYTHYFIRHRDGYEVGRTKIFNMPPKAYRAVSYFDHHKEFITPCKIKILLPKDALRTTRPAPRVLPLP